MITENIIYEKNGWTVFDGVDHCGNRLPHDNLIYAIYRKHDVSLTLLASKEFYKDSDLFWAHANNKLERIINQKPNQVVK